MQASDTIHIAAPHSERSFGGNFLKSLSEMAATFRVAVAWSNHRRSHPADLAVAGFDKEFEDRVMGLTYRAS